MSAVLQYCLLCHQCIYLLLQFGKVFAEYSPDDDIVHLIIAVYHKVAQVHNPACVVYADAFIQFEQVLHGFANDFQFTLYSTTQLLVALILKEVAFSPKYSKMESTDCCTSYRYFFTLFLPINQAFGLFHFADEEGVRQ